MNWLAVVVLSGVLGALGIFYLSTRLAVRRQRARSAAARPEPAEATVQCFSCGMSVPRDKALEKKGRYFCGVKRNDRHGNPVDPAHSGGGPAPD